MLHFHNGPNQRLLAGTRSGTGPTQDSICDTTWPIPVQRYMPFGLQEALATFQRLMDRVLRGLDEFAAAYLDDVVVFSSTWVEYLEHLRKVMQRLRDARLTVKLKEMPIWDEPLRVFGACCREWRSRPRANKAGHSKDVPSSTYQEASPSIFWDWLVTIDASFLIMCQLKHHLRI